MPKLQQLPFDTINSSQLNNRREMEMGKFESQEIADLTSAYGRYSSRPQSMQMSIPESPVQHPQSFIANPEMSPILESGSEFQASPNAAVPKRQSRFQFNNQRSPVKSMRPYSENFSEEFDDVSSPAIAGI
jgi:hypothetical protein